MFATYSYHGKPIDDVEAFCREHACDVVEADVQERDEVGQWITIGRHTLPGLFWESLRLDGNTRYRNVTRRPPKDPTP